MNKILIIVKREYVTRVRRRSFLITTLLAPLGFFLLISASVAISTYSQGKTTIAVIDDSGLFKDIAVPDPQGQNVYFKKVDDNYDTLSARLPAAKEAEFQGIIYIPANFDTLQPNNPSIAYRYIKRPGLAKQTLINRYVTQLVSKRRMQALHIDAEVQNKMQEEISVNLGSLTNEKEDQGYTEAAGAVGMVMGFAIYISLFFYGTMIMKSVMEEKTNRIVEVLTSSVKPFQLLMGKILGVGAVGVTQFILWLLLMMLVYMFGLPLLGLAADTHTAAQAQMNTSQVDSDAVMQFVSALPRLPLMQIAILFPFFFLGGFLLYGSLFAAVGAAMGEDGDQQSLMVPITVPIIISILIAINVINNPDSSLGFWGSIIPFTSPVVMSVLVPFKPAWWQIALSIVLLVAGFVFTTYIAARIYRVGILMYGKKIKIKEVVRWIFTKG